jgi:catechol 2,3-dioxygenase-like lactoylglutathione lyase family enzyme
VTSITEFVVGGVRLERPFAINRLGHFGLYQRDLSAAIPFYRDLLGLRVTDAIPQGAEPSQAQGVFFTFGTDHHALVLLDAEVGKARDDRYSRGVTLNQMSFQVGTLREVVEAHEFLAARQVPIWRIGRDVPGSNWAVYALDLDGHPVELFYGMEQIGWDRRSKPAGVAEAVRGTPPLPQEAELDELAKAIEASVDLDGGVRSTDPLPASYDVGGIRLPRPFKVTAIGPIALFVRDVEAAEKFYSELYGMACTERVTYGGRSASYLRIGTDHHVLALVPNSLRDELGFTSSSTLMSCGLRLGSYAQLRDAVAFLQSSGAQLTTDLPHELCPGIEHAAYVTDPDGHRLLLYCAIEQVGWDGKPKPVELRPKIEKDWPQVLERSTQTYAARAFQGPIG